MKNTMKLQVHKTLEWETVYEGHYIRLSTDEHDYTVELTNEGLLITKCSLGAGLEIKPKVSNQILLK